MRGHRFHTSFGAVFGGQYVDDGLRVFADHLGIFNFGLFAMPIHSMLTRPGNWMAFVTWQLVFFLIFSQVLASCMVVMGSLSIKIESRGCLKDFLKLLSNLQLQLLQETLNLEYDFTWYFEDIKA